MDNPEIPPETPPREEHPMNMTTPQTGPLPIVVPNTNPSNIPPSPGLAVNPDEKPFAQKNLMSMFDAEDSEKKYYQKYLKYKSKYTNLKKNYL